MNKHKSKSKKFLNKWNKIVILVVMTFLVIQSLSPAQMTSEQDNADDAKQFSMELTVSFSVDDLEFGSFMGYDTVMFEDGILFSEPGKPNLPARQIRVALPNGTLATDIQVIGQSKLELPGDYNILPTQPPRRTSDVGETEFVEPDPVVYASSRPYPSELARFLYQTDLLGQGMAVIQLYPLQYIPAEKKLTLHTSIIIEILGVNGYKCGDYLSKHASEAERTKYKIEVMDMVINPDDVRLISSDEDDGMPQTKGGGPSDYDYVIITQNSWMDDFQPLADWKTRKGVPATIVDRDWIYSQYSGSTNQDKIQAFVRDAADPSFGLTWDADYFLLGGDSNVIPYQTKYYYLEFSSGWEHIYAPSDSYYGDYDQDFTCEVHVGRASVITTSHVSTFINKVFTYEQNPPLTNYAKKAALFGFDLDSISDGEDVKIIIDDDFIPSTWTMSNEYDSESGTHETDVKNYINAGQHLINHIDHAYYDLMGVGITNHGDYLTRSEVDAFSNGDKQSILYSTGCYAAAFDYDCIAEHFVRDTNGGCIAFIGNSRYGIYQQPGFTSTLSNMYDREFFEAIFEEGHYILGKAFSDHKNEGPTSNNYDKCVFDELNLLGDPELNIWTENPDSLDVTHPSTLPPGPSTFLVHVEDDGANINNAYVCLWKDDEVYLTGTTDIWGDVTFYPSPLDGGTMYVTVTKHNYIPYMGSAEVPYHNSPYEPSNPDPADHAKDIDLDADLSWDGGDPDTGNVVYYDIYFDTNNPPQYITTIGPYNWDETRINWDPGTMNVYTKYYWKIIADDTDPETTDTEGPIWKFTTEDNVPPEWRNQGQNKSTVPPGDSIKLYAQGRDNIALDYAYLATNETGEWIDFSGGEWWDINWDYCKKIIIDHTLVEDDLTDFPVLITHTSSDFTDHAQTDGDDFVFVDISNTTQYAHEIEYYDSATGELWAWVNIPLLSSTEDTVLYVYYGNSECNNRENVEGTWNSGYIMVQHMTGDTYTDLDDSTSNSWDVTSQGGNPSYNQIGKVGRCVDFDGSGDYFKTADFRLPTDSSHTGSAWVYVDGSAVTRRYAFEGDGDYGISLLVWTDERFKNYARSSGGTPVCYSTTTVDVGNPQWFYICTRADADNDQLDIFINGIREDNTAISGMINPETQGLNIGTYRDNNNYWMNGKIDEIRISNIARSDSWIKTEYNNMISPTTFSTIGIEQKRSGGEKYGSPTVLGGIGGEWVWSNFTWQNSSIPEGTVVGWRICYVDSSGNVDCTDIYQFHVNSNPSITCGDINNDMVINVGDVVYLINYLYRGGDPPIPCSCVGDVNNDDTVNVGDVVYLINYLYRGGDPPDPDCCNPPWGC